MTMILSAHIGDCIVIAADKRSMICDIQSGALQPHSDQEQKIKLWPRGAIAITGEKIFSNRIEQHFINHQQGLLKLLDLIDDELNKRMVEGVPIENLKHSTIVYSYFDGNQTRLFSISTAPFLDVIQKNGNNIIQPYVHEIKENFVNVNCFNIPADISSLQNFQKKIKPLQSFTQDLDCINYYITLLKPVFVNHASIDPSITTCFDLYIQSCETGKNIALHVPNLASSTTTTKDLNYFKTLKKNQQLTQHFKLNSN